MIISIMICMKLIIKPTKHAIAQLHEITESMRSDRGDLKARLDITTQDEIGQLSEGINSFLDILDILIYEIRTGSNTLNDTIQAMATNIEGTDGSAMGISAAMEELSATMEEVSATAASINTTAGEVGIATSVEEGTNGITQAAEDTSSLVEEITKIKEETDKNKEVVIKLTQHTNRFV